MRPFRLSDLPTYQGWFSDPDTQRWVSQPDDRWWVHVSAGGRSTCRASEDSRVLCGVLQVDWEKKGYAFVCVVVDPAKRGRGLGTRLLRSFLAHH